MKEGGCLIVISLLICIESCSSLDYENICKHHFSSLGCPVYDGDSWRCAKVLTNCSGDQFNRYHCVLNSTGQSFKVIHTCAPLIECDKGTMPIYDKRKKVISCKPCRDGYYQRLSMWSDEAPMCSKKHKCEGNKIECDTGTGLSKTHDVHCRCDARNNFILTSFERRGMCVEWDHVECYQYPCLDGQERLLNYSCAPLCPQGQKRDDNDICNPISLVNQTTSSLNDSLIMSDEVLTKTTRTTPLSPTTSAEKSPIEIINGHMIILPTVMVVITVLLLLSMIVLLVCWKLNILQKCKWSKCKWSRKPQVRRQSSSDAHSGVEQENMAARDAHSGVEQENMAARDAHSGVEQENMAARDAHSGVEQENMAARDAHSGVEQENMAARETNVVINVQNLQIGHGNLMNILKPDDQAVTNGDAAESNSSSVGNQGSKAHVDEEKGNPNINPLDCPGNFRSIRDETDAVYNLGLIVEVAKSVGIIWAPGIQGTGFRVGGSYIMTALHVVRGIINSVVPPVSHREGVPNLQVLEDPYVHIDFDYSLAYDIPQHGQALNRSTQKFNFEPVICYENEILDTAVLKLKRSMWNLPCQLTRFGHCLKNLPMNFVGHSEGKVKQSDKSKPREDVTSLKIQECQRWSKQHPVGCRKEYHGYEGAENRSKILFDCTFSKGASGSPGFIISSHNHMPYIVTMLLCGYPDWLYDENVSGKEKTGIQDGYTFEQGVCLTEVYNDMKVRNPELCLEIFGA